MKNNCMDLLSKFIIQIARVTLLLLVNASTLFSQEIEWQNTIGGNQDEELYYIQQIPINHEIKQMELIILLLYLKTLFLHQV